MFYISDWQTSSCIYLASELKWQSYLSWSLTISVQILKGGNQKYFQVWRDFAEFRGRGVGGTQWTSQERLDEGFCIISPHRWILKSRKFRALWREDFLTLSKVKWIRMEGTFVKLRYSSQGTVIPPAFLSTSQATCSRATRMTARLKHEYL